MQRFLMFFLMTFLSLGGTEFGLVENALAENVLVENATDGGSFEYTMVPERATANYSAWRLTWPTPYPDRASADKTVIGFLYLPADITPTSEPRTGLVCLDGLGGNGAITGLLAVHFASCGFPVLLPVIPYTGERAEEFGSVFKLARRPDAVPELTRAINQIQGEIRRGIDLFMARPEVRDDHVHFVGASLGAILTTGVAARDVRVDKMVLLVGGGKIMELLDRNADVWQELVESIRTCPEAEREAGMAAVAGIEPFSYIKELSEKVRQGKIRMLNAEKDEIIPPEISRELAEKIGLGDRQEIFPGVGHMTALAYLPTLLPDLAKWLADDSIPLQNPRLVRTSEEDLLGTACEHLLALVSPNVDSRRTVHCRAELVVGTDSTNKYDFSCDRQGTRFSLEIRAGDGRPLTAGVPQVAVGQAEYPWLVLYGNELYLGSESPVERPLSDFLPKELLFVQQMATGLLTLGNTPEASRALHSLLQIDVEQDPENDHAILVRGHQLRLTLELSQDFRQLTRILLCREEGDPLLEASITKWESDEAGTSPALPERPIRHAENGEVKAMIGLLAQTLVNRVTASQPAK